MANRNLIKNKPISLAHQRADLSVRFPNSLSTLSRGQLYWKARVKPLSISREYTIEMRYCLKHFPNVYVVGDELRKLDSPDFPHHYLIDKDKQKVELCLFRYSEFKPEMLLSETVIPWSIEWLYYYEIWLSTGEWKGGGEHPKQIKGG